MENTPNHLNRSNSEFDQALARIAELEAQLAANDAARRDANDHVQRMIQRLEALHSLDLAMLASGSLDALASLALDHIVKMIPCYRVSIGTVNPDVSAFFALATYSQEPTAVPAHRSYPIAEEIRATLLHAPYMIIDNSQPSVDAILRTLYDEGIRTIFSVGLRVEEKLVGLLNFHSKKTDYFTEEHRQIAIEIATQLAIGIHKATLNDALSLHARRLDILHQIDLALIRGESVEVLVNSVCGSLREFFRCEQAGAVLFDYVTRETIMFASNTDAPSALDKGRRYPMMPDMMEELTAQKIAVMEDFQALPPDYPKYRNVRAEGMRSSVSVRMNFEGQIIGLLVLNSTKPYYFSPDYQQIAAEVGDQLAIAIHQKQIAEVLEYHTAQLEETNQQIQHYNKRLAILHQLDRGIISATEIQAVVAVALDQARQVIQCQQAGVLLFDFEAGERIVFSTSLDAPSGLLEGRRGPLPPELLEAVGTEKLTVIDDIQSLPDSYPLYRELRKEGIRAALRVRLVYNDQVLGLFVLNSTTPAYFTAEYQEIASEIGDQLAIAIYQKRITEALVRHSAELEYHVAERTSELRVAKEQVEAILDNSADGVILLEASMTIQKTNAAFCQLFRCQDEECLYQPLTRVFPSDTVELIRRTLEDDAPPITNERIEVLARRNDGTEFDAEVSVGHIKQDGLVCIIRDVSERKRQERQLRYHAILQQNMSDAVIATDMAMTIQSWNKAAERIYGWNESEVIGRTASEVVPSEFSTPDGRAQAYENLRARGWWQAEVIQARKDGSRINILGSVTIVYDDSGQQLGIVAVNRDISERIQAEDALRQSESRYRLLAENVRDLIVKLSPEGIRTFVTPSSYELLGYAPEELIGLVGADLIHPDDRAAALSKMRDAIMSDATHFKSEQRVRHKNGHYVWVETQNSVVRDASTGRPIEIVSVIRNITERKRAEDALRIALNKEKELGELKTRFVAMASHEFRNPLATILTTTETLTTYRQRMTDEQIDARLGKIQQQVEHLNGIMEDFLQLGRMQTGRLEFQPVLHDLDAFCREIIEAFHEQTAHRGRILYECSSSPVSLRYDQHLMQLIINNLISNALKYSPNGKAVLTTISQSDSEVVLRVQDQGIGIPVEDLKYLFEPFHRAANVGAIAGTGLGLNITKQAVEMHGGTISVESQVGVGTTFIVTLPKL